MAVFMIELMQEDQDHTNSYISLCMPATQVACRIGTLKTFKIETFRELRSQPPQYSADLGDCPVMFILVHIWTL